MLFDRFRFDPFPLSSCSQLLTSRAWQSIPVFYLELSSPFPSASVRLWTDLPSQIGQKGCFSIESCAVRILEVSVCNEAGCGAHNEQRSQITNQTMSYHHPMSYQHPNDWVDQYVNSDDDDVDDDDEYIANEVEREDAVERDVAPNTSEGRPENVEAKRLMNIALEKLAKPDVIPWLIRDWRLWQRVGNAKDKAKKYFPKDAPFYGQGEFDGLKAAVDGVTEDDPIWPCSSQIWAGVSQVAGLVKRAVETYAVLGLELFRPPQEPLDCINFGPTHVMRLLFGKGIH